MKVINEGEWIKPYNLGGLIKAFYADDDKGYQFYFPISPKDQKLKRKELKEKADIAYEDWKNKVLSGEISTKKQ